MASPRACKEIVTELAFRPSPPAMHLQRATNPKYFARAASTTKRPTGTERALGAKKIDNPAHHGAVEEDCRFHSQNRSDYTVGLVLRLRGESKSDPRSIGQSACQQRIERFEK